MTIFPLYRPKVPFNTHFQYFDYSDTFDLFLSIIRSEVTIETYYWLKKTIFGIFFRKNWFLIEKSWDFEQLEMSRIGSKNAKNYLKMPKNQDFRLRRNLDLYLNEYANYYTTVSSHSGPSTPVYQFEGTPVWAWSLDSSSLKIEVVTLCLPNF